MIQKPSWEDAPEWAKYLAQDFSGQCGWYERKPFITEGTFYWDTTGKSIVARSNELHAISLLWGDTLEERPKEVA